MRAFSLVELSIVLVILGLLTGGILAGQSFIRAAEIRNVTASLQRYQSAYYSFRDKYMAIPGDAANATQFWGIAGGTTGSDTNCYQVDSSTLSDPKQTCNGTGDGWVSGIGTDNWIYTERFRFWQHLGNAGLIEGSYSGRTDSTTLEWQSTPGKNLPSARISGRGNAFYGVYSRNAYTTGNAHYFDGTIDYNFLTLEVQGGSGGTWASPLHPEEMWNIDTKLDDGSPAYGRIRTVKSTSTYGPNCATSDAVTAEYNVANSSAYCYFFMALK